MFAIAPAFGSYTFVLLTVFCQQFMVIDVDAIGFIAAEVADTAAEVASSALTTATAFAASTMKSAADMARGLWKSAKIAALGAERGSGDISFAWGLYVGLFAFAMLKILEYYWVLGFWVRSSS